jgi:glycosyltransferase involved in cell wall biosynthesis
MNNSDVGIDSTFLTICIPTYNRREAILDNIKFILNNLSFFNNISFLVIDNASEDGTYDALLKLDLPESFRIEKNLSNIGFFGSFIKSFSISKSEYILFLSDEDHLIIREVQSYVMFLKNERPSFVSPQFFKNNTLYRGKKTRSQIAPKYWKHAGFYISGLTFSRKESLDILQRIESFILEKDQYYGHCLLIAEFIVKRSAYWWDRAVAVKVYKLPSSFALEQSDSQFNYLPSRWRQHLVTDLFFEYLKTIHCDEIKIILKMQNAHRDSFFDICKHAISQEAPHLIAGFVNGAKKSVSFREKFFCFSMSCFSKIKSKFI